MQPYPDRQVCLVGHRAEVDVLPMSIVLHKFSGDVYQLVNCVGERYLKNGARAQEPLVVFTQAE